MADDKKPPQSGEDRDLQGLAAKRERERRNAPAGGVPIIDHAPEDRTPVGHIIALINEAAIEEDLKGRLAKHAGNLALRVHEAERRTDLNRLADEIDDLQTAIVDIRGEHGNNGKLGALKARVDAYDSKRWAVIMYLVGAVLTVLGLAIAGGRWIGRIETDVDQLKSTAQQWRTR